MKAYNVTINGSTRRVFASNMRVAIDRAMRGAGPCFEIYGPARITKQTGTAPFEKQTNINISAVLESNINYGSVKVQAYRLSHNDHEDTALGGWDKKVIDGVMHFKVGSYTLMMLPLDDPDEVGRHARLWMEQAGFEEATRCRATSTSGRLIVEVKRNA